MRRFVILLFCFVLIAGINHQAWASEFPNKPITLVCASKPGAPVDVMARMLAKASSPLFDQPVQVLTKASGGGGEAMAYLQGKPADGYTIFTATKTMISRIVMETVPFKIENFDFVCRVQQDPYIWAVRTESKFKDLPDLIQYAQKNPGAVSVAGFARGSMQHLMSESLAEKAGIEFTYIPFQGASEALMAVLGGKADIVATNIPIIVPQQKAGKVRALGFSGKDRLDVLPGVPTFSELGYPVIMDHWRGLWVKSGTPKPVMEKLEKIFNEAINGKEFGDFEAKSGNPPGYLSSDEFSKFMMEDNKEVGRLLNKLGMMKKN